MKINIRNIVITVILVFNLNGFLYCVRPQLKRIKVDVNDLKNIVLNNNESYIKTMSDVVLNYELSDDDIIEALSFENSKLTKLINTRLDTMVVKEGYKKKKSWTNDPVGFILHYRKQLLKISQNVINESKYSKDSIEDIFCRQDYNIYGTRLFLYNLAKIGEYDIIQEELERFRILAIAYRKSKVEEYYSPDFNSYMIAQEHNFYNLVDSYCCGCLRKRSEMKKKFRKVQLFLDDVIFNYGPFGEFFIMMQAAEISYSYSNEFLLDEFCDGWEYRGQIEVLRSRLLRKDHSTEKCIELITCRLDEQLIKKKISDIENPERVFMHLAFLNYSINKREEAMMWFNRALTDNTSFTGDWDYWLDYRFYEKGEKKALMELKEQYLREKGK